MRGAGRWRLGHFPLLVILAMSALRWLAVRPTKRSNLGRERGAHPVPVPSLPCPPGTEVFAGPHRTNTSGRRGGSAEGQWADRPQDRAGAVDEGLDDLRFGRAEIEPGRQAAIAPDECRASGVDHRILLGLGQALERRRGSDRFGARPRPRARWRGRGPRRARARAPRRRGTSSRRVPSPRGASRPRASAASPGCAGAAAARSAWCAPSGRPGRGIGGPCRSPGRAAARGASSPWRGRRRRRSAPQAGPRRRRSGGRRPASPSRFRSARRAPRRSRSRAAAGRSGGCAGSRGRRRVRDWGGTGSEYMALPGLEWRKGGYWS